MERRLGTKLYNRLWEQMKPGLAKQLRKIKAGGRRWVPEDWDTTVAATRSCPVPRTAAAAREALGGLSNPSKMPGLALGLPAAACRVGSLLREVEGSVCFNCYAHGRGYYGATEQVLTAQIRRLAAMPDPHVWSDEWVRWAALVGKALARQKHFRFHDSGDTMGKAHALAIVLVAVIRPDVDIWVPSKERKDWWDARRWLDAVGIAWPSNLVVRLSSPMNGRLLSAPGAQNEPKGTHFPTSSTDAHVGHRCPASKQGNMCGDCRACWDSEVENVDYPVH